MGSFAPLSEFFRKRAREPGRRKGERTRDLLKAAASELLERSGYRNLRVSDINELARVSNALFYVYFNNKMEISQEILAEFLDTFEEALHVPTPVKSSYQAIYLGNLAYVEGFASHPGLMRCLLQFGDEVPEFSKLWRAWNGRWVERVARALGEHSADVAKSDAELRLKVVAVGSMVDGFLRTLYVDRDRFVVRLSAEAMPSVTSLARFLSELWYRAIYGHDPTLADLQSLATEAPQTRQAVRSVRARGRSRAR